MNPTENKNEPWKNLWLLLFFSLVTVYFTWPLINGLSSSFIAEKHNSDATQYIWNSAIFDQNISKGQSLFETNQVLVPLKTNLWMHTYTPLMSAFCLMFENKVLGLNLFLIIHFLLAAIGAYLLANRLLKHFLSSVLVALLFAFSPFKMVHLPQHYHLILCGFSPWFILSFLKLYQKFETQEYKGLGMVKWISISLVLWALNLLCDYYTAAFLIYFVGLFLIYKISIKYFTSINKLYILGGLGLLFVLSNILIRNLYGKVDDKGGIYWGGDLINLIMPNNNTFLFDRSICERLFHNLTHLLKSHEHQLYLGLINIGLIIVALVFFIKNRFKIKLTVWLFVAIVFMLIVFPSISILGHRLCYAPTALLHFIPFFNNIRCPTRILGLAHLILPLSLLIYILPSLLEKYSAYAVDIMMGSLVVFSLADLKTKPYNTLGKEDIPQAIHYIQDSKATTLLSIPTGIIDGMSKVGDFNVNQLYYQTIHQKQLIGGYISRLPKETFDYYKEDSVMNYILRLSAEGPSETPLFSNAALSSFHQKFHPDMIYLEQFHAGEHELNFFKNVIYKGRQIKETKIGDEVILEVLD